MSGNISLSVNEKNVREDAGSVSVSFSRSGDLSRAVTITYEIQAGTATPDRDYEPDLATVRIAAGERRATIDIPILDDNRAEDTEDFIVAILDVSSGNLTAPRTTRVNILDDERPVVVEPEPPLRSAYNVKEVPLFEQGGVIDIDFLPGDLDHIMLVLARGGMIRAFDTKAGEFLSEPFYQFTERADTVFSMEVHPDFPEKPFVYAYYKVNPADTEGKTGNAGPDGDGARFQWLVKMEADPDAGFLKIIPGSEEILLGGAGQSLDDISGGGEINFGEGPQWADQPASDRINLSDEEIALGLEFRQDYIKGDANHFGGGMAFGPDGMLYLGIGDGDPFNYAHPAAFGIQDPNALSGKIVRIDPLTGEGLRDNPFIEPGDSLDLNRAKVYQIGLRNPFSIMFDEKGRLVIADTGQSSWEEINIGAAGSNFGWPFFEGADGDVLFTTPNFRPERGFQEQWDEFNERGGADLVTPAWRAWSHRDVDPGFQFQAITGSKVEYSGNKYPASLKGHFVFSDYSDGEVFTIDLDDRHSEQFLYKREPTAPVQFIEGPDGYVYYAALESREVGRLEITSKRATSEGDLLVGNGRDNTINGRGGSDVIEGRGGEDRLSGGGGHDRLLGEGGHDRLSGGDGRDRLYGGNGNDHLFGGSGEDRMFGGRGRDTLDGGRGEDLLVGGRGDDHFRFDEVRDSKAGAKRDVIRDFERGDKIDLSRIDANENRRGDQDFRWIGDDGFNDRAGELRYKNGVVRADVDGDGRADFEIAISNDANLRAGDFLL